MKEETHAMLMYFEGVVALARYNELLAEAEQNRLANKFIAARRNDNTLVNRVVKLFAALAGRFTHQAPQETSATSQTLADARSR
jgi:hypothetical protein